MTKRVTVSLPDDVAAYLEGEPNASAEVTAALRARMDRAAATVEMLRAVGIEVTEAGRVRAQGSLPRPSAQQRAEAQRRLAMVTGGTWPAGEVAA